jgi:hypothetical protein
MSGPDYSKPALAKANFLAHLRITSRTPQCGGAGRDSKGAEGRREAGKDPKRIRYGCFLPDLTGLATASSVTNLPRAL